MSKGKASPEKRSTRRSFLRGGALLAAPLAVAAPAAAMGDEGLQRRLARLEDEAAIRELHRQWLGRINAGGGDDRFDEAVRHIAPDPAGQPDAIEIAADGKSAVARFYCAVDIETGIAEDCTLARMARAQGGGCARRTEYRVLTLDYVKTGGAWAIKKAEFAPV